MKHVLIVLGFSLLFGCGSAQKKKNIEMAHIYYEQGTNFLYQGSFSHALKSLTKAIELNPHNDQFYNNLGMAYFFKNAPDQAISNLEQSLKINPKNSDTRNNLATVYLETGNLPKAEELYTEVAQDLQYSKSYQAKHNLGILYLKQSNPQKAIPYFQEVLREQPNYCPSNYQMGKYYKEKGNLEKALSYYKKSTLGSCYNNPKNQFELAQVYKQMQKIDSATIKFSEVLHRFPDSPYANLAKREIEILRGIPITNSRESASILP